jgi:hypothetical protein
VSRCPKATFRSESASTAHHFVDFDASANASANANANASANHNDNHNDDDN